MKIKKRGKIEKKRIAVNLDLSSLPTFAAVKETGDIQCTEQALANGFL